MHADQPSDHVHGRFVAVAIVVPLVLATAGVFALLLTGDRLPDPIATRWSMSGEPNQSLPLWGVIAGVVLVGGVLPAAIGASSSVPLKRGARGMSFRFLGASLAGMSGFVVVAMVGTALAQTELVDVDGAAVVWGPVACSLIIGSALGVLGWAIQPRHVVSGGAAEPARPLGQRPGERVAWMRETAIGRVWVMFSVAAVVLIWASVLITWSVGDSLAAVGGVGAAAIAVTAAIATVLAFRVRIDRRGLCVTSVFGVPRFSVKPEEIERVEVVEVNPLGEFGGYGVRWRPGRLGVVLRTGEAIEVHRTSGRSFVVTVDDAETGAAVLASV